MTQEAPYAFFLELLILSAANPDHFQVSTMKTSWGLQATLKATGPFAPSLMQDFVRGFCSIFAERYAQGAEKFKETTPLPVIELELNGQRLSSIEELQESIRELPNLDYDLGSFRLSHEELRVTDPCYEKSSKSVVILKALPDTWNASCVIGPTDRDLRVKMLQVSHTSMKDLLGVSNDELIETRIRVDVDSAQCGFFDEALYPKDKAQQEYRAGTFYYGCCEATRDPDNAGGGIVQLDPPGLGRTNTFSGLCYT